MNEEHAAPEQYWVRTQAGQVMGPLTFVTIEMLAGQGIFGDTCEVSLDGMLFAPVGEMPVIRDAFPRSMWGDSPQEEPVQTESLDLEPSSPGVALDFGPAPLFDLPAAEEPAAEIPVDVEVQPPTAEAQLDGLEDLALDLEPPEPPPPAPPISRAPASFVAPRVHAAPAGERVHQAPTGERVHAAPAGEPAARLHDAPAGAVAPRSAPDPVQEGVPLPELIPSGRLVPGTGLRLYYLVAVSRGTGLLTLTPAEGGGSFGIFFKKGKPEQVRTEDARHSLSSHLVRTGKLTAEKAIEAEAARGRFGGEVVNALFALGLLDPSQAFALLAEHGRTALEQALRIDAGRFEWDPSAPLPGGTMPLGAPLALLGAAGRIFDPAQAFVRLGSRIDCPVIRAGDGLAEIADLALTAVEARVVAAFDGTRSLAEIAAASPSDAGLVYRLGWFLGEVGFASFARAVRPRPASAPLLGPAPPVPGEQQDQLLTDPALDAFAAPMPPPGTVLAPGLDTSGPAAPVMPRVAAGGASAPVQPPAPTSTRGPPTLTPGPAGYTPGPPAANPFSAPPTPGAFTPGAFTPGAPTPGAFTPGAPTPGAFTPGAPARARAPASPFEPGPSPLPRHTPVRTPGPFTGQTPAPQRAGPSRAASPAPTPGPAPVADEASLHKLLERMAGQDHFAVLGLTRGATNAQVKQAYLKLAREHHPDTAGPAAPPEVRQLKEQITARLNEAYQEIGTDDARSAYVASLSAGARGKQVDLSSILAAEEAFNMAAILVKARKYADALTELAKAIELNAEEGEFYAWRGFARFSAATDKRSMEAEAMADVKKALKLNPRCAVAHLFAARIAQVLGNGPDAARSFRRCLELDPQNLEAQRELRLLESRAGR